MNFNSIRIIAWGVRLKTDLLYGFTEQSVSAWIMLMGNKVRKFGEGKYYVAVSLGSRV